MYISLYNYLFQVHFRVKYLLQFTTCLSDNNDLFRLFLKYSSSLPPVIETDYLQIRAYPDLICLKQITITMITLENEKITLPTAKNSPEGILKKSVSLWWRGGGVCAAPRTPAVWPLPATSFFFQGFKVYQNPRYGAVHTTGRLVIGSDVIHDITMISMIRSY